MLNSTAFAQPPQHKQILTIKTPKQQAHFVTKF